MHLPVSAFTDCGDKQGGRVPIRSRVSHSQNSTRTADCLCLQPPWLIPPQISSSLALRVQWMRIVLKWRRVAYLSVAALASVWWMSFCICVCRLSPFTAKTPLPLEKGVERGRARWRGGREAAYGRGRRGRDRKREAGREEEEGGKTHRGKHPPVIFSALNSAVSVWCEWAFLRKAAWDGDQASKEQHLNSAPLSQDLVCCWSLLRSRTAAAHKGRATSSSCRWMLENPSGR